MNKNSFTVVDVKTGVYPDLEAIALHEDWAKGLVYCDMDGFAIMEDGSLILMDECNNSRCCPIGRFEIVWNDDETLLKEQEWYMLTEDDDGIIHGLPGDDGQYLMTDGKDIWIDEYVDGVEDGIILDSGRDIREITAWMYKPELPKKDRR